MIVLKILLIAWTAVIAYILLSFCNVLLFCVLSWMAGEKTTYKEELLHYLEEVRDGDQESIGLACAWPLALPILILVIPGFFVYTFLVKRVVAKLIQELEK